MDQDQKSAGETSSNIRSTSTNSANNSSTISNNSNISNHKPSSSSSSHRQQHISNDSDMSLDGGGGDDLSWWDCSLCTYRNSADKFKCEICDLRRGTSTRKPRCNADTIVAQVVKQQEQIRQQTKTPKAPKSRSSTSTGQHSAATSTTDTKPKQQQPTRSNTANEPSSSDGSSDETSILESSSESSSSTSPAPSSITSSDISTKSSNNPFKITPVEVNGNLIKYSPPTSSGRTGLIIDKKRFTQHSVTVNDVTITFTEFATRQNRYVRKKKKRRDNRTKTIGNGKN